MKERPQNTCNILIEVKNFKREKFAKNVHYCYIERKFHIGELPKIVQYSYRLGKHSLIGGNVQRKRLIIPLERVVIQQEMDLKIENKSYL